MKEGNLKTMILIAVIVAAACLLQACKATYQYDKYGMQRMSGVHQWSATFLDNYHNGAIINDSTYALPDTSFFVAIIDKSIVQVAETRLYIVDPYTTASTIVFVNDTGLYCGPACHKIFLYYNYNANTINITDGVYNINNVDDTVHSYTTQ